MNNGRRMIRAALIVLLAGMAGQAGVAEGSSAQLAAARAMAVRCTVCHGIDGRSRNPTIPNLAGQNANYFMHQLAHFKDGERQNPMMEPIAQSLSSDDMSALAEYYASLPLQPSTQP